MEEKRIHIAVEGKEAIPYNMLVPFQGDLKHLEKTEYEKLRKGILDLGYSFVCHVWKHDDKAYLIDGHQRIFTVKQMVEIEGYVVDPIPVAVVKANSFREAKMKVLAGVSQYGKVSKDSLMHYAKENDIPIDDIVATFSMPEVDFSKIVSQVQEAAAAIPELTAPPVVAEPEIKSGSGSVRQLQLFFSSDDYVEFVQKVDALKSIYQKDNVTDALMEIVRETHSAKFPPQ